MKVGQNLNMQLQQKLALSNEMLQSLEIIQLPVMELKDTIDREVLENPALELIEKKNSADKRKEFETVEEVFDERDRFYSEYSVSSGSSSSSFSDGEGDGNRAFLEGVVTRKEGLHDWLHWQLNLTDKISEKQKEIGCNIISFIDNDGFFKENLNDMFPENPEEAADVLDLLQTFDPPGVASAGIREALLYQIESLHEDEIDNNAYVIIKEYFELLLSRKDSQIAKNMQITVEEVKTALEFLSKFEPYPGRAYDNTSNDYVVPDAFVYRRDNEIFVEINDDVLPSLTVSKYLERIASDAKKKKKYSEQVKYASEKVSEAKKFINIIQHRNSSLKSLIYSVVKHQEAFFEKGPKHLVPLTMKAIGDEIGLAESTISRLASSKYIQTEWGLHAIKYFFTNSINKEDSSSMSSESVREIIKEIIEENEGKKMSDQKIADILNNRGINIARRTVAKYRNKLNILPSGKRNI